MRRTLSLIPLLAALLFTSSAPPARACEINPATGVTSCCKVCKGGKACGDSCIARNKSCNKGRGCACNG